MCPKKKFLGKIFRNILGKIPRVATDQIDPVWTGNWSGTKQPHSCTGLGTDTESSNHTN